MLNDIEILLWLREKNPARLEVLWQKADLCRQQNVGDEVHIRGLIEISNYCRRRCHYCGLNAERRDLMRYRMTRDEILACCLQAKDFGYGTVVLQAGEDEGLTAAEVTALIRAIKEIPASGSAVEGHAASSLAVTLSLGERTEEELWAWRQAGADRYFLRFETSDMELYRRLHPPHPAVSGDRLGFLRKLREMGYEVGSGIMVGIPGQTWQSIVGDLKLFATLDLDMIGIGPYHSHPATSLGQYPMSAGAEQVPNDGETTCKVIALARLLCPQANIPSTTALAVANRTQGYEMGLRCGANVIMANLTPWRYRCLYEIYPGKAGKLQNPQEIHMAVTQLIQRLGRIIGRGHGGRLSLQQDAVKKFRLLTADEENRASGEQ